MINRRGWKKNLHRFQLFLGVFLFFSIFLPAQKVQASNGLPEDINYDEIQEVIYKQVDQSGRNVLLFWNC